MGNTNNKVCTINNIRVGDIIYITLSRKDGLIVKWPHKTRRKYIVILGHDSDTLFLGYLLINSKSNKQRFPAISSSQYLLKRNIYPNILNYDSWLDCSEIFEIEISNFNYKIIRKAGQLTIQDLAGVLDLLKSSELISEEQKERFGII